MAKVIELDLNEYKEMENHARLLGESLEREAVLRDELEAAERERVTALLDAKMLVTIVKRSTIHRNINVRRDAEWYRAGLVCEELRTTNIPELKNSLIATLIGCIFSDTEITTTGDESVTTKGLDEVKKTLREEVEEEMRERLERSEALNEQARKDLVENYTLLKERKKAVEERDKANEAVKELQEKIEVLEGMAKQLDDIKQIVRNCTNITRYWKTVQTLKTEITK